MILLLLVLASLDFGFCGNFRNTGNVHFEIAKRTDDCHIEFTGEVGKCKRYSDCHSAQFAYIKLKIRPTVCSFDLFEAIVCCLDNSNIGYGSFMHNYHHHHPHLPTFGHQHFPGFNGGVHHKPDIHGHQENVNVNPGLHKEHEILNSHNQGQEGTVNVDSGFNNKPNQGAGAQKEGQQGNFNPFGNFNNQPLNRPNQGQQGTLNSQNQGQQGTDNDSFGFNNGLNQAQGGQQGNVNAFPNVNNQPLNRPNQGQQGTINADSDFNNGPNQGQQGIFNSQNQGQQGTFSGDPSDFRIPPINRPSQGQPGIFNSQNQQQQGIDNAGFGFNNGLNQGQGGQQENVNPFPNINNQPLNHPNQGQQGIFDSQNQGQQGTDNIGFGFNNRPNQGQGGQQPSNRPNQGQEGIFNSQNQGQQGTISDDSSDFKIQPINPPNQGQQGTISDDSSDFKIQPINPPNQRQQGTVNIIPDIINQPSNRQDQEEQVIVNPVPLIRPNQEQIVLNLDEPSERVSEERCANVYDVTSLVGGDPTKIGEYPFMAAIGWKNSDGELEFNCGGFLVSRQFVLTAAHCTNLGGDQPFAVRTGGIDLDNATSPNIDIEIDQIFIHPNYNVKQTYDDIAILKLKRRSKDEFACLWQTNEIDKEYEEVTAIGYGHTEFAGPRSNSLLQIKLKLYENQQCSEFYPPEVQFPNSIINTQICSGDITRAKDTCQGDSGGPIFIEKFSISGKMKPIVIGLTSFGQGCAGDSPSVYTRISSYLDWIESIVWP